MLNLLPDDTIFVVAHGKRTQLNDNFEEEYHLVKWVPVCGVFFCDYSKHSKHSNSRSYVLQYMPCFAIIWFQAFQTWQRNSHMQCHAYKKHTLFGPYLECT